MLNLTVAAFAQAPTQKAPQPQDPKSLAELYYANEKYRDAVTYYLEHQNSKPKDLETKFRIGRSFYELQDFANAEKYLLFVNSAKKEKKINKLAPFFLARTYHQLGRYDDAIAYYKIYLSKLKGKSVHREEVKDEILRCSKGRKIAFENELALVENLGLSINSEFDEFNPVFIPGYQNVLYFSSIRPGNFGGLRDQYGIEDFIKGEFYSDIFRADRYQGEWMISGSLNDNYNSIDHDVVQGFSRDGSTIYLFKGKELDNGNLYSNNFRLAEGESSAPEFIRGRINSGDYDGSLVFMGDSLILYSSNREGGYGGKDIYISKMHPEGYWLPGSNLGPIINTPYDEESPYLTNDGRTLYFSSNNLKSIGGYDVFRTRFIDSLRSWTVPENLALPINSPGDDLNFKVSDGGLKAHFSSNRNGSYGKSDIYVAYFKRKQPEQIYRSYPLSFYEVLRTRSGNIEENFNGQDPIQVDQPVVPVVVEPDQPVEKVDVDLSPIFYKETGDLLSIPANTKKLNTIIALAKKYPQIIVEINAHTPPSGPYAYDLYFSVKRLEEMSTYLVSKGVSPERVLLKGMGSNYPLARNDNSMGRNLNRRIELKLHNLQGLPVNLIDNRPTVNEFIRDAKGDNYTTKVFDITYKIQIKALKQMYEDPILTRYQDAMIEWSPTIPFMRYTLGLYKSYYDAENLRRNLVNQGFADAFVVPYYNGVRLSKSQIKAFANDFPELSNLLPPEPEIIPEDPNNGN